MTQPELNEITGIGPTTLEKLASAGYNTVMSIAVSTPSELKEIAGVTEKTARKFIQEAKSVLKLGFTKGNELWKSRDKVIYLKTNVDSFDSILGGGFQSGAISEVYGMYGSGKCVAKDTPILIDEHKLIKIEDLWDKNKIGLKNDTGEVQRISTRITAFDEENNEVTVMNLDTQLYREKVKYIYKIKTEMGREINVTGNHKLPIFDEGMTWKRAKELNVSDLIRIPKYKCIYNATISTDDAYFLGMFVAEGTSNPVSICNSDDKIINYIRNYIIFSDGYEPTIRKDKRNDVKTILIRKKTQERILKELMGTKSATKFIPECVMKSNDNIRQHFLQGYLDGDGEVRNGISATTKSKVLAQQLTYLLNALGYGYTQHIRKHKIFGNFYNIRIVGSRKENLVFITKKFDYKAQEGKYGISSDVTKYLKSQYKNLPFKKRIGLRGTSIYGYLTCKIYENKRIGYNTFLNLKKVFEGTDAYEKVKYANFFIWDKIKTIKVEKYNDYVYDLVVPKHHNFIGGNMPTLYHNTQLAHLLAVSTIKNNPKHKVAYIDTENTFRPNRINDFCKGYDIDIETVKNNIMRAKAFNSDHQMLLVEEVDRLLQNGEQIKLLIVDSLTAHFRAEFTGGRGELAPRQQKLNKHMHSLLKLADVYNIVVLVTNQVLSNPGQAYGDPTTPVGGNIVGHTSTFRIYLRPGKAGSRVAKLVDSPDLPENSCIFNITETGLVEVK